ncbi:MAG: hypothetical protein FWD52_07785 [Candidatus Bathyarchaeota archaeon]|nr:hypothetical protein [Candidatus Termiticorpusculum sp.]
MRKKQEVKTKTRILLVVLSVLLISAVSLTYRGVAQSADKDSDYWILDLKFQSNNGTAVNGSQAVFAPFDLITLKAEIANASVAVPESTVVFNIKGPKTATHPTEIIRSGVTDSGSNSSSIDFRIPIEGTEKVTGEWHVYVNTNTKIDETKDVVLSQNVTFQVAWPAQNVSIAFVDAQGQSQSSFNAKENVTALVTYDNNRIQAQNISLNIKDSAGNAITQQTRQVTTNTTTNSNKVAFEFTIPKNTPNGTAQAELNIYSGVYQNRNIPVAENKTVTLKIGNTTDTPPPSTTPTEEDPNGKNINWLPWLAAITGIITFIILFMFLKRRNNEKEKPTTTTTPPPPQTQTITQLPSSSTTLPQEPATTPSPIAFPEEAIRASLIQMQAILSQQAQPDMVTHDAAALTTHLSNIANTTKKIQELQTALKTEQEHLNKNINELNQTIEKQEKIIKNYYDTIRNQINNAQQQINPQNSNNKSATNQ